MFDILITTIAMGNTKLNDIYQKTQIDRAKISVYIKNLIDLNILNREFPVSDGIKSTVMSAADIAKVTGLMLEEIEKLS